MDESVFVHKLALLESEHVGSRSRIWAFAHVMPGARIGAECNIGEQVFVEGGVTIGDRVTVKNGVAIWTGVTIEDDVFVGPNAVFTNDLYPRSRVYHDEIPATHVGTGASIGANATIIAGNTLGEYCMVGAGSVVTKDVKPYQLVAGNPARPMGWMSRTGQRMQFENGEYSENGLRYKLENSEVTVIE
jgi:acetyltransferase-like isoleucine patch superfamily enzyme